MAFYDGKKYILDGRKYEESDENYTYTLEDYEPIDYQHFKLDTFPEWVKSVEMDVMVAHNGINFDWLVLKAYFGMDYDTVDVSKWCGKNIQLCDSMILSKVLNPDRFGGHSLDTLAQRAGATQKLNFRKKIPKKDRFKTFAADMLYYNIFDTRANTDVYYYLLREAGDWDWNQAIVKEHSVAYIITMQAHRGFHYDYDLGVRTGEELDVLMKDTRDKVEAILPPRPPTKSFLAKLTPPVRQISRKFDTPPKRQFKGDGRPTKYLSDFVDRIGGELVAHPDVGWLLKVNGETHTFPLEEGQVFNEEITLTPAMDNFIEYHGGEVNDDLTSVRLYDKFYDLPMPCDPIKDIMPPSIDDSTAVKGWLIGQRWDREEYDTRDICCNSKKIHRTTEQLHQAIDKYVEETLGSPFEKARLAHFKATKHNIKLKIFQKASKRKSCHVLTSPKLKIGQEKRLCAGLERLSEKFPYAEELVKYLTYRHRRNTILGGKLDWEDASEAEKGYLAHYRPSDGRIGTPAGTCDAATSRMTHKKVANVPSVGSIFGEQMRAQFGVSTGYLQLGYDFSSLEARIEGSYCWKFDDEVHSYCNSLLRDTHQDLADKVTEILNRKFERKPAKSVRYGCTYGAQVRRIAATVGCSLEDAQKIYDAFWELAGPLKKFKDYITHYWKTVGQRKYVMGLDGRKVPTRAEHALVNSTFQSAGVICAKYVMIEHYKLLKEEGLIVDFFEDDWKNKHFVQQLIAYHKHNCGFIQ